MFGFILANAMLFIRTEEMVKYKEDAKFQSDMKNILWDVADKVNCRQPKPDDAARCLEAFINDVKILQTDCKDGYISDWSCSLLVGEINNSLGLYLQD